ncbi:hypothetical protein [Ponticaulis sp.]|uniref:hypothetical protein n=1 Tax=Ponticaulis sp. TaxID=2020902 RepID=UPI000B680AEE|nr:hypothetical protein [Ponticaulis sp.]MAJ09032.1 hypothetical protein [Ponticaulis sp.]RPG16824.1 MAG: hypothetical protein CBC85_007865 [Hyphomonadaceae bacterium TMED125]HBH90210.1 hypothetical protein [Hyphomonadaceae bacterium]HBJ93006.1 hypothetical protein [Hyphomonadaceae bacterium]
MGFAGILFVSGALAVFLASVMGWGFAILAIGALLLLGAGLGIAYFAEPFQDIDEEFQELEDAAADALADLPFDTLKSIVDKRPLTSVSIAAIAGYSVANDPSNATKQAQRLMFGLL